MTPALWCMLGLAGGTAHFVSLHWNARAYLGGGGVLRAVALHALRMALTALVLLFAAWHGAAPLLLCAGGVVLGRSLALRMMASLP